VRRTINGSTVRYIEYLDDAGHVYDRLHVDSGVTYDHTVTSTSVQPATASGLGVVFTAGAPVFAAGDVGKQIRKLGSGGRATIVGFTDTTHVTADITTPFPDASAIPAGGWSLCPFTIGGLLHLAGKTVKVSADGAVVPGGEVTAFGALVLAETGTKLEVGLGYESVLVTMRPEAQQLGTIMPVPKLVGEIYAMLYQTLGIEVNGRPVPFRQPADLMGEAPPLFTGAKNVTTLSGETEDGRITIAQRDPLPMTVLFLAELIAVGA
jgi:hypothetical protein